MDNRERFLAAMAFEPLDRPCHLEHGFWDETVARWTAEGLPSSVTSPTFGYLSAEDDLYHHFDVMKVGYIIPYQYFLPKFEKTVVEENDHYRIERDEKGVLAKFNKQNVTIPHFIDYPVKNRHDYLELRERLVPKMEPRFPEDWAALSKRLVAQRDAPTCTHMDGFFGYPRELMGLESFLVMLYDDPDMIRMMIEDRVDFYMTLFEKAIQETKPDFAFIWEDMCYKNGPLLSPDMFDEFMLPAYRRLTSWLKSLGVKNIVVDSDGDVLQLIPHWLAGGVTGLLPFEVSAGMDVVRIGQDYPGLQLIGGIDKREVAKGRDAIDAELDRVLPAMMERGGYCLSLDHWVPPSISLDDFRHYVDAVRNYQVL